MGLFSGQLSNVVEWKEYRDDVIFWKWSNDEIKKGSRLIIRPGQDAIFMYNGKNEGIFTDEGSFDIESDIIPFLSTLKGFRFGFNSGIRAEVLFVNTKEFTIKWGTKNAISIPAPQLNLPGGMPIRAFGTFSCKVSDYQALIDKVAGVRTQYTTEDIKERVLSVLDQLLMKWITREGKDMFNLQANAYDISRGIKDDLDMELCKLGISITEFNISSVTYPEEVQKMQARAASQSMVGEKIPADEYGGCHVKRKRNRKRNGAEHGRDADGHYDGTADGKPDGTGNEPEQPDGTAGRSDEPDAAEHGRPGKPGSAEVLPELWNTDKRSKFLR